MEDILMKYREENKTLQRQVKDYQTFSLEMIRLFHNRVQEKVVDEDTPDFMKDLYAESPTYFENDSLKGMLETFVWMSYSDSEKKRILDADLDAYFKKFDESRETQTNTLTNKPHSKNSQNSQNSQNSHNLQPVSPSSLRRDSPQVEALSVSSGGSYTDGSYSDDSYGDESYGDADDSYEYTDERGPDERNTNADESDQTIRRLVDRQ